VQELRQICEAAGRDPASLDVAYIALTSGRLDGQKAGDGERRIFTGARATWPPTLPRWRQAGVRHVCLTFQTGDLGDLERIEPRQEVIRRGIVGASTRNILNRHPVLSRTILSC
jgi:hypothetical protein